MTYALFGKFTAGRGRQAELLAVLTESAETLRADAGCLHFVVGTSDEPDAIWVWEAWTDKAAHDAAVQRPEIRALMQRGGPLIAGVSDSVELTDVRGAGLPG